MENLFSNAFQRLSLLEQDFDFSTVDKDKVDELSAFISDDVEEIPEEPIIDVNAETEDDLADNYIGKVILECECCHTRIYKNEDDVVIDDEAGLANVDEACPVCNNSLGYTVIGKIEAYDSERVIEPEDEEEDVPEEAPEEVEIEDEEEEKDESLKSSKVASEDSKKLSEAKLPLHDRLARKHLDNLGDVDEKLNSEEAARMAEITKNGTVKASDRNEYNELRKKDKEVEEGMYDCQRDKDFDDAVDALEREAEAKKADESLDAESGSPAIAAAMKNKVNRAMGAVYELSDEAGQRNMSSTKRSIDDVIDAYEDNSREIEEELLDHGNDNLEASDVLATKDTKSLEDDQTELTHAAGEKIEAINEACEDDVCPECGKNPCVCEACCEEASMPADDLPDPWGKKDESLENNIDDEIYGSIQYVTNDGEEKYSADEIYDEIINSGAYSEEDYPELRLIFDKAFNKFKKYYKYDESLTEAEDLDFEEGEIYDDVNGNPWMIDEINSDYEIRAHMYPDGDEKWFDYQEFVDKINSCDESLTESVELHTDGEPVDLVKNDDGTLSLEIGNEEASDIEIGEPIEAAEEPAGTEEIVPLEPEDQSAIEANTGETDEFAEEPVEDEFAEEPVEGEEEEEEEPFESLEASGKPAINESAKETSTIQDKIDKETLKQARIETKMMQLDLAAKQAEVEAAAPVEEVPAEEVVDDEVESEEDKDYLESVENFDEAKFNSICEAFLKRVYGNVKSFNTTNVKVNVNEALVEGIINFNSGKTKSTTFKFANPEITKRGKLVMEGFNKTFSEAPKAFKLKSTVVGDNMVAESMIYNYTTKQINESNEQEVLRIYGRVKA